MQKFSEILDLIRKECNQLHVEVVDVRRTNHNHLCVYLRNEHQQTLSLITAGTPSDYRSRRNCLARVRRFARQRQPTTPPRENAHAHP